MTILTELQEKVLALLFGIEEVRRHYYLTGGTALAAYYLEHRLSDDLDLFTHTMPVESVERTIESTFVAQGLATECLRRAPGFRSFRIGGGLRLDLVRDVDFRVGVPELIGNIMVDSVKNIAVNKVLAILGRFDPKDYVDLFFLLKGKKLNLFDLMALAAKKDAGMEPFQWARVIADAQTISVLPRMVVPCDVTELQSFFEQLRDQVLLSLKPKNA